MAVEACERVAALISAQRDSAEPLALDRRVSKPQARNQFIETRDATQRIERRVKFEKCRKRLAFV